MPLSHNIKRIRLLKKFSVRELAELMGTNRQSIYDWESGAYEPSPANLDLLASVLGVSKKVFYDENLTLVKEPDISTLDSEYRELQSKYIRRLEADIKLMENIIQTLKKRLVDAGLDASDPKHG